MFTFTHINHGKAIYFIISYYLLLIKKILSPWEKSKIITCIYFSYYWKSAKELDDISHLNTLKWLWCPDNIWLLRSDDGRHKDVVLGCVFSGFFKLL